MQKACQEFNKVVYHSKEFLMDMYQIVDSESLLGIFDLPLALRNRKVEVRIRALEAETRTAITGEKGAWERVVIENYAKD